MIKNVSSPFWSEGETDDGFAFGVDDGGGGVGCGLDDHAGGDGEEGGVVVGEFEDVPGRRVNECEGGRREICVVNVGNLPGGIMVIGLYFFQFEVYKVLRVEWALFLDPLGGDGFLFLGGRVKVDVCS